MPLIGRTSDVRVWGGGIDGWAGRAPLSRGGGIKWRAHFLPPSSPTSKSHPFRAHPTWLSFQVQCLRLIRGERGWAWSQDVWSGHSRDACWDCCSTELGTFWRVTHARASLPPPADDTRLLRVQETSHHFNFLCSFDTVKYVCTLGGGDLKWPFCAMLCFCKEGRLQYGGEKGRTEGEVLPA